MNDVLGQIRRRAGLSERDWHKLLRSAPYRYKVYYIPKRRSQKVREIAQPASELKAVQRIVVGLLSDSCPVHPIATAYRKMTNIVDNAQVHAESRWLLKLDFEEFFPNISANDFLAYLQSDICSCRCSEPDAESLARLLFRRDRARKELSLSIGAPSSPWLSNIIMYEFDRRVKIYCEDNGYQVSRYADDLSISGNSRANVPEIIRELDQIVKDVAFPNLRWNREKIKFISKKDRRIVTGVVLEDSGKVGIGREARRRVRAALHKIAKGEVPEEGDSFTGYLAFMNVSDPERLRQLLVKYEFANISAVTEKLSHNKNG